MAHTSYTRGASQASVARWVDGKQSGGFLADNQHGFWKPKVNIYEANQDLLNVLNNLSCSGVEMLLGELMILHRTLAVDMYGDDVEVDEDEDEVQYQALNPRCPVHHSILDPDRGCDQCEDEEESGK